MPIPSTGTAARRVGTGWSGGWPNSGETVQHVTPELWIPVLQDSDERGDHVLPFASDPAERTESRPTNFRIAVQKEAGDFLNRTEQNSERRGQFCRFS